MDKPSSVLYIILSVTILGLTLTLGKLWYDLHCAKTLLIKQDKLLNAQTQLIKEQDALLQKVYKH